MNYIKDEEEDWKWRDVHEDRHWHSANLCVLFHFLICVHMSEITEGHAIWYIYPKPKKIYCWLYCFIDVS